MLNITIKITQWIKNEVLTHPYNIFQKITDNKYGEHQDKKKPFHIVGGNGNLCEKQY